MPKNWKYIKKLLEKEFLCEKLKGHITYDLTTYKSDPWYWQHFIMKLDDEILIEASERELIWDKRYDPMRINRHQINSISETIYKKHCQDEDALSFDTVETIVQEAIKKAGRINAHNLGIFGVHDIIDAIGVYLHSDIDKCLEYEQGSLVCAFGVLDRRCGKRRLKEYAGMSNTDFPAWLKHIF